MEIDKLSAMILDSKQITAESTIEDHFDGISDLSLNPQDSSVIAASSFDKTISLYDLTMQKETVRLKGHEKGVWTVNFHPSSNQLLSGGNDNTVLLWDPFSNKIIQKMNIHKRTIYDVQFSKTGNYFASCSKDIICIWDIKNLSKPIDTITERGGKLKDFVYCLNFIDEDKKLITGFIDGTLILHQIGESFEKNYTMNIESKPRYGVNTEDVYNRSIFSIEKFKNDDNKFVLSHSDGSVHIYSYESGKLKLKDRFHNFTERVLNARTNYDDSKIIACGRDRNAKIWEINNHDRIEYILCGHTGSISSALFAFEDKVVTGAYDCQIKIWKLN